MNDHVKLGFNQLVAQEHWMTDRIAKKTQDLEEERAGLRRLREHIFMIATQEQLRNLEDDHNNACDRCKSYEAPDRYGPTFHEWACEEGKRLMDMRRFKEQGLNFDGTGLLRI